MRPLRTVVIHHSASSPDTTVAQIRRWHVEDRGLRDVGYHYVIDGTGTLHPCRPLDEVGAHARGHNTDTIGICVTGNNTVSVLEWRPCQILALQHVVKAIRTLFPGIQVVGHKALTPTVCPGVEVKEVLES